ncbi:MAG TPA: hypothetical protein VGG75_27130 [Trebonia sp.]|jgi:hypothetical protein
MPDVSVLAAIITTAGTLGGALGGVALTNWTGIQRDDKRARRERADAETAKREHAYAALLQSTAQLRALTQITCQRHWKDLNVRLAAAQNYAVAAGQQAAHAALLSNTDQATASIALATAASGLASWLAEQAQLGDYSGPGDQFQPGEVRGKPDFAELDSCTDTLVRLAKVS